MFVLSPLVSSGTLNLIHNSLRYYEIYSLLLPIHTVATVVKAIRKYSGRVSGCNSNPHSPNLLLFHIRTYYNIRQYKDGKEDRSQDFDRLFSTPTESEKK
jgi:hypothetical protein